MRAARLPKPFVWMVLGACALPSLLGLAGVDLGAPLPVLAGTAPAAPSLSDSAVYTILQWSSFWVAAFTLLLAFAHFSARHDPAPPVIAAAFLCAAMLDEFHSFLGEHFAAIGADALRLYPFTWAICRSLGGLVVLAGAVALLRERAGRSGSGIAAVLVAALVGATVAYGAVELAVRAGGPPPGIFPEAPIKRPYDLVPLVVFAVAGVVVYRGLHRSQPSRLTGAAALSFVPAAAAQLHLALGSSALLDHHFVAAHLLRLVTYLGMFAALAFEYARVDDEVAARRRAEAVIATRARQQAVVAELGMIALGAEDLDRLMDLAAERVAATLEVEYCEILELLASGSGLRLRSGAGWKPGVVGAAVVPADRRSQAGYTLLSRAPVISENLRTESRFEAPALLEEHGVVSGISVVIEGRERPFGVLGAHSARPRPFTREDASFMQVVSNILAAAVERGRADEALRESGARYRGLVEQMPAVSYVRGLEAGYPFLYVSPQIRRLLGYSPPELVRRPGLFVELVHPDDRARVVAGIGRCLASGGALSIEYRMLDRQGRSVEFRDEAVVVRDDSGQPQCLQGLLMRASERRAEPAAGGAPAGEEAPRAVEAATYPAVALEQGRIIDASDDFAALLGYDVAELIGRRLIDLVSPDDRAPLMKSAALERPERHTLRCRRRDGAEVTVEALGATLQREGRSVRVMTLRPLPAEPPPGETGPRSGVRPRQRKPYRPPPREDPSGG